MPKTPAAKAPAPATMELTPDLVATTIRIVEDEGPEPNWNPISPEQLDNLVSRVEKEADDEEIWVFAYGSLMWNPGFEVAASEEAVAYGWHRAFSLRIERLRATSDAPGLMLALRPGGSCSGLASSFRASPRGSICVLFWRERFGMSKCATWCVGLRSRHRRVCCGGRSRSGRAAGDLRSRRRSPSKRRQG